MHAFPHHQVHTVATKEQAGVKKAARSMRALHKNDALWTMDSPFDTKGDSTMECKLYSPVDTMATGGIVYSPSGQNPYTEAMDKTLKDLPTLSLRSKPNLFAYDGVKASSKASRWVGASFSSHPFSLKAYLLLLGLSSRSLHSDSFSLSA